MKRLILGAIAIFALMPQAHGSALIADCTVKANASIKTMPAAGDEHLFSDAPKELEVEVYDEYGGQWAYIESSDKENPLTGWVLRSSLYNCVNLRPWKN